MQRKNKNTDSANIVSLLTARLYIIFFISDVQGVEPKRSDFHLHTDVVCNKVNLVQRSFRVDQPLAA